MLTTIKIFGYGFGLMFVGLWALTYGLLPGGEGLLYIGVRLLVATVAAHAVVGGFYRIKYREHYAQMRKYRIGR